MKMNTRSVLVFACTFLLALTPALGQTVDEKMNDALVIDLPVEETHTMVAPPEINTMADLDVAARNRYMLYAPFGESALDFAPAITTAQYQVVPSAITGATVFGQDYFPDATGARVVAVLQEEGPDVAQSAGVRIIDVQQCVEADNAVTFTLTNRGDKTWDFTNDEFATDDLLPVRVFLNQYEVTSPFTDYGYETEGVLYDDRTLAEACGVTQLMPGESFTCTLQPAPINEGVVPNQMWVDVPGATDPVEFVCA